MTNADKLKNIFGLYATELWSMPEKDFLKWLNSKVVNCSEIPNNSDTISRQAAIDKFIDELEEIFSDIREREVDDSVCGLCEYDGAYIGQSGDWCNECPGFDRDDCFKLSDKTRKEWTDEIIKALPSVQPERKTGRWIYGEDDGQDGWYCSECNGFVPWDYTYYGLDNIDFIDNFKVCPFCEADMISRTGADMRGEKE